MPIATPDAGKSKMFNSIGSPPSAGVKVMVNEPAPGIFTSVALY